MDRYHTKLSTTGSTVHAIESTKKKQGKIVTKRRVINVAGYEKVPPNQID